MKRILLSIIAIILCLFVFSGCDAECEHNWERIEDHGGTPAQEKCTKCGETRPHTVPDSTPSERLSIEMTIAEALPSCVTFEYKDENPYCFYAYDGNGKLYRVLWNNFDGLHEKDRIVVDYNDIIKTLSYDEYPDGGWTPQYEIAAVSVISNETPQYQYSSTSVRSGKNAIRPIQCFEGSTRYENGEVSLLACGGVAYGIFYDPKTKISDFPVLLYAGAMMAFPSANVTLGSIRVYDTAFQELEYKINEIGELASLPHGEYIVTIAERIDSRGGNEEIKDYHITDNVCLFRFVMRDPPITNGTDTGHAADIKMMRFNWDGYGISTKRIEACDLAYSIIDAVEKMTETGETVEKISDDVVNENTTQPPIERGTMWIELGSKIYRIDPDFTQLCLVDRHLGKGYVMNASSQLKKMISDAWQYHPYDYYTGSYNNRTDVTELYHVYNAPSDVRVHIKKMDVINDYDPQNKITVELISSADQTVHISLLCSQSGDNLAEGDQKDVALKAGRAEIIELSFGGWKNFDYWIDISVDNTRINLRIEP